MSEEIMTKVDDTTVKIVSDDLLATYSKSLIKQKVAEYKVAKKAVYEEYNRWKAWLVQADELGVITNEEKALLDEINDSEE